MLRRFDLISVGLVLCLAVFLQASGALQGTGAAIPMDPDDIAGVVTGPRGPEAGVWVIAETTDLPTKFVRIVVTDNSGRYLVPDLPKASYRVWTRGYGLVDSPKVESTPGKLVNLTAVPAPDPQAASREVHVDRSWVGRSVGQIEDATEARVPFIFRMGTGIIPRRNTLFQDGDLIYAAVLDARVARVEDVLSGPPPAT